jgi:hypothetical protein
MSWKTPALVTSLALASGVLVAQVPEADRIPVTDAARLEAWGFSRDARHVAISSKATFQGVVGATQAPAVPDAWGSNTGYTPIAGFHLLPADPASYIVNNQGANGAVCLGSGLPECLAYVQIPLPEGVVLDQLEGWAYDVDPDKDLHYIVVESCQTPGGTQSTILGGFDPVQSLGDYYFSMGLGGGTTTNRNCYYVLRVKFTDAGEPSGGYNVRAKQFQVRWTRQVSPAPATATFGDVPTGHPFFRFVEALAASGITGGCGGGNFCPDQPLTRGQMAVFLAAALGLSWP